MSSLSYSSGHAVDEMTVAVGLLGAGVTIGLRAMWQSHPEVRSACLRTLSSPEVRKAFGDLELPVRRALADFAHRAILPG